MLLRTFELREFRILDLWALIVERLAERKARILTYAALADLDDHILQDIGVEDDLRCAILFTREQRIGRFRAQALGGRPFFW